MEQTYYKSSHPDSFGSAAGVLRQTKSNFNDVKQFLSNQDAYTLHADVRRRFARTKTLAFGKDDLGKLTSWTYHLYLQPMMDFIICLLLLMS